jgi:ATP adenylyltransferase
MTYPSNYFWQKVLATTDQALRSGALQPIATRLKVLPDRGISFKVRILDSLNRKEAAQKRQATPEGGKRFNPFLPYEEALFVDQLSQTHICLLNKFNVVDHHLLIVTREYESQDTWLTHADFEALAHCMLKTDGLGFYNGGAAAGASQHHKHLQLIPLEPQNLSHRVPLLTMVTARKDHLTHHSRLPELPFLHSIQALSSVWEQTTIATISTELHETYQQIMAELGLNLLAATPDLPYNLLITRDWMIGIGRSQAAYEGIGVNSLGYAGWLLVKNADDLKQLEKIGPLNLLQTVGCPPPTEP